MKKNLIIAFLLGFIFATHAEALKVPDVILGGGVDPDLREVVEDYIIKILNEGKYVMRVSGNEIAGTQELSEGEFMMDNSGVNKYIVVSNGSANYRVQVNAF